MKIAIAQINTTVGDFDGNAAKIMARMKEAEKRGANLCVFPELAVCGYPPRDLLEKPDFIEKGLHVVETIAKQTSEMAVVLGFPSINDEKEGRPLFNSAALLVNGKIAFVQHKTLLPEYDVFDDARHFEPAHKYGVCKFEKKKLGLSMCEDIWSLFEFKGRRIYHSDPIKNVCDEGADIVINLSASPFTIGKHDIRKNLVCGAAKRFKRPIVYCNLVGGNDELVFDGKSFVANKDGELVALASSFEEDLIVVDMESATPIKESDVREEEELKRALILGLKDYMKKCGFKKVVIGLSGGIDSALVAALACEAIGPENVMGVMMPSPYSSKGSVTDSEELAKKLGMNICEIPIGNIYASYRKTLVLNSEPKDLTLTEENIQARIRGNILMAMSNKEGALVLSTGNKSELSVGYCTLYGDMAGGLALISDLPKTTVYKLARYMNEKGEIIPRAIIDKPPSAELKPDQVDEDSLPPYDELDPMICAYVEDRKNIDQIVAMGFDRKKVERVVKMIDTNEYKRRQASPGIKVTSKAFGLGRRLPIAWKP